MNSALITDEYVAGTDLYQTTLIAYSDGDYGLHQTAYNEGEDAVYLNKQQAIAYAKIILKNEGIHAID